MRVALVVPGGFDRSGRERVIPVLLALVERLARTHDVHVFVTDYLDEPGTYPLCGATIHDLGRAHARPGARAVQQLTRLLAAMRRAGRFDVVHGYWASPCGLLAAVAGRILRVPTVVTCTGGEFVDLPECGYGLQGRWQGRAQVSAAASLANVVHVPGSYMANLATGTGIRAVVLPLGVDTTRFAPIGGGLAAEGPPWRLLQVASLSPVKDQSTLLLALARLVRRWPPIHLDIVGEDTRGGAVQAEALALGLGEFVTFHGYRASAELVPFYRRAHLFVQSSRHEASGIALLEAAACGLPAVGTRVGTLAELAPDAAYAVPIGDPAALSAAIRMLLEDPKRRLALGAAARNYAVRHDADWSAAAIETMYASAAARGPSVNQFFG